MCVFCVAFIDRGVFILFFFIATHPTNYGWGRQMLHHTICLLSIAYCNRLQLVQCPSPPCNCFVFCFADHHAIIDLRIHTVTSIVWNVFTSAEDVMHLPSSTTRGGSSCLPSKPCICQSTARQACDKWWIPTEISRWRSGVTLLTYRQGLRERISQAD